MRRLQLQARRLLDSRALGGYDSLFRGHGIEFAEVRAYEPGDPFQAIDWKVTARMGRPYVKRFVEERELNVLLALDLSGSTRFGTRSSLKWELALEIAAVLGLAAIRNNDRVGWLLFTDRIERFVPPGRGARRLSRLLYEIVGHAPAGRGTDLARGLDAAERMLPVRSLLLLLSDFQDEGYGPALSRVSRRHEVVALEVRDPAETRLPAAGLVEVEDPESGRRALLDLGSRRARQRLEERLRAREREREALLRRYAIDHFVAESGRPYFSDLAAFLAARVRRRGR